MKEALDSVQGLLGRVTVAASHGTAPVPVSLLARRLLACSLCRSLRLVRTAAGEPAGAGKRYEQADLSKQLKIVVRKPHKACCR